MLILKINYLKFYLNIKKYYNLINKNGKKYFMVIVMIIQR